MDPLQLVEDHLTAQDTTLARLDRRLRRLERIHAASVALRRQSVQRRTWLIAAGTAALAGGIDHLLQALGVW